MQVSDLRPGDKFTLEYTVLSVRHDSVNCATFEGFRISVLKTAEVHSRTYKAPVPLKVGDIVRLPDGGKSRYEILGIYEDSVWLLAYPQEMGQPFTDKACRFVLDNS